MHYRTYRNEYNRDKSKRRNIKRSNNGHRGEQQASSRNPRQDNFNNVITFQQANSNHQNNESEEVEDTLVDVSISINRRTSSIETIIHPETQYNDKRILF